MSQKPKVLEFLKSLHAKKQTEQTVLMILQESQATIQQAVILQSIAEKREVDGKTYAILNIKKGIKELEKKPKNPKRAKSKKAKK